MIIIEAPSPNYDERTLPISMLVLHYTGMQSADAALERLCDQQAKVSAHYMIDELGRCFRLVNEDQRAWHAGVSEWRGIADVNSASIGIEIVNGGHDYGLPDYPHIQIRAVIALCKEILNRRAIGPFDVVGHSDIAPLRKQDPGEKFPWADLAANYVGIWPDSGEFNDTAYAPKTETQSWKTLVVRALSDIGYAVTNENFSDVIQAFQRRYRPQLISGILDVQTLRIVLRLRLMLREGGSTTKVG